MKISVIKDNAVGAFHKTGAKLQKHSPEILLVAGITGAVVSTVMACRATMKVDDILDETKDTVTKIHETAENEEYADRYTEEDAKKDLTIAYTQAGVKLVKLYAPAVGLGALSIVSILASNNILHKRNVALAAAYATIDQSFKDYRSNVVERFGEKIDHELRYNIKAKEIEETTVDENGNETTTTKTVMAVDDPTRISGYARYFERYTRDDEGDTVINPYWEDSPEYNLMFLKSEEKYWNDILRARKGRPVFLNEVYKRLGIPVSKAGQIVGWTYNPNDPSLDNFISFGLYDDGPQKYSDYLYGNDDGILLDFNVQGNVWDLMK